MIHGVRENREISGVVGPIRNRFSLVAGEVEGDLR
jgi:hypothetical protein